MCNTKAHRTVAKSRNVGRSRTDETIPAEESRHFGVPGNVGVRLAVRGLRLLVPERLRALPRPPNRLRAPGYGGGGRVTLGLLQSSYNQVS